MATLSIDKLIDHLQQCKDMPYELTGRINDVATETIGKFTEQAGKFLSDNLDDSVHTKEQVQNIIDVFPQSLSVEFDGRIPIQIAVLKKERSEKSISFLSLLAKEGNRLNAGGDGMRGGLLLRSYWYNFNILQYICKSCFLNGNSYDEKCANIFQELHDFDLLKKEDVKNFHLLSFSSQGLGMRRFKMIASLDPDALERNYFGILRLHCFRNLENRESQERFEMHLKAGMEHFPEKLGFLFQKYKGKTACEVFMKSEFDVDDLMAIICRCIPPGANHPILHRAAEVAPHLECLLIKYYRDEVFCKDPTGRTLPQVKFHASLRNTKKSCDNQNATGQNEDAPASIYFNATDEQIGSWDPRSGLYPFMMVASIDGSDLDVVNYLLRRCPEVLSNGRNTRTGGPVSKKSGIRKRKHEAS